MRPVSGRKPFAGSSVVMRHWSAAPRRVTVSWERPRSARVSPAAMRSCDWTRSTSVTSSVTVCSTWMRGLDVDAGVRLEEDVVAVAVEEELHGAGVAVADLPGEACGVVADAVAQGGVEVRRGGEFDDLLVAALHGAVPLEEVHDVALAVGEDLHLDVAGLDDGLLQEDG